MVGKKITQTLVPRVVGHLFAYEDLVKSGFGGEHIDSNHRLI